MLVVIPVMDRSLRKHMLRTFNFEWDNSICYVLVLHALIDDCSFRSLKERIVLHHRRIQQWI